MTETWKAAPGYEGIYEVSSQGNVKSLPRKDRRGRKVRGGLLARGVQPSGHQHVKLSRDGITTRVKPHRLVLTAFSGHPKPGQEALHGDGDPAHNSIANLRWGTRSENIRDSVKHGTHHWANKTQCPQDHPYDHINTHRTSDGRRMCRECMRASARRRQQRMKEAA